MRVRVGLDVLVEEGFKPLRGARVGLVCHPASVDRGLRHAADILAGAPGVELAALFGPEHGVRGEAQDMIPVGGGVDRRTGHPVYSLYGDSFASLSPTPEQLAGLDALVIDLQDVGARYYTFVWTMALCMEAAGNAGVRVLVLDRPNPLGGEAIEGDLVAPGYGSFVGLHPVPVRHGLTAGELAWWLVERRGVRCELNVIPMQGWLRRELWSETGRPWVPPSPNMPTFDTALVYPGLCLVEGTNLSEGRGTTRPFEQCGAPFLDPWALAERLSAEELPGVRIRPVHFAPTFHKFAGQTCGGVFLHVSDRELFRPYQTGVALLRAARALAPETFRWRTERYEFVDDKPAVDLLSGGSRVRELCDAGAPLKEICAPWARAANAFREERAPFLLYG